MRSRCRTPRNQVLCANYAHAADSVLRFELNLADLEVAHLASLPRQLRRLHVPRLPVHVVTLKDAMVLFDPITLLEHVVADDEPTFRLLLSPLRELAISYVAESTSVKMYSILGVSFCHPRRGVQALPTLQQALCLTHWLGQPEGTRGIESLCELPALKRTVACSQTSGAPDCGSGWPS